MKAEEYAQAILMLPINYRKKEIEDLSFCKYGQIVCVSHKDETPMVYSNGKWKSIEYHYEKNPVFINFSPEV